MNKEFVMLDLFSGAGGFTEGFIKNGFDPIAHIEMVVYASMTLQTRTAYYYALENGLEPLYREYLLGEIRRNDFLNMLKRNGWTDRTMNVKIDENTREAIKNKIINRMKEKKIKGIDLIIGGPPCQAYSIVGRSRKLREMENDPRNNLYLEYLYFVKEFKPQILVFENVPGIITARKGQVYQDLILKLDKYGYRAEGKILDARNFMVLQKRQRLILIGWRKDQMFEYPEFESLTHGFTVNSLLSDLPPIQPEYESGNYLDYIGPPSEYLKITGIRGEGDILTHHVTRKINERDRQIYKYAIDIWNKEKRRIVYNELPENLKTHRNRKSFLDRFKVVPADLPYAQTITAHISKDGHYYIHPDQDQLRSISVREAARIQSFPDSYLFEGPITNKWKQIGNAVPPLMSWGIAVKIREILEGK